MKLCIYNDNKLGVVEGQELIDVSEALEAIPQSGWPRPPGDAFIASLGNVKLLVGTLRKWGFVQRHASVQIHSPVANPTKVIGAPVNYKKHLDEAAEDEGIHFGQAIKTV